MKKIFGNAPVFVILYILCMFPTYILPWVGSNSAAMNAAGTAADIGISPAFWMHLAALLALIGLTWIRGSVIGKTWLVIFPFLALVFDLTPVLNWIPFVPTVMHLLAIILGVESSDASVRDAGRAGAVINVLLCISIAIAAPTAAAQPEDFSEATAASIVIESKKRLPLLDSKQEYTANRRPNLPIFSPSGRKTAYTIIRGGNYWLIIVDLETLRVKHEFELSLKPFEVTWSKDGNHLIVGEGKVQRAVFESAIDIKSGEITRLPDNFPDSRLPFKLTETNRMGAGHHGVRRSIHKNARIKHVTSGRTGLFISNKDGSLDRLLKPDHASNLPWTVSPDLRYLIYHDVGYNYLSVARLGVGDKLQLRFGADFSSYPEPTVEEISKLKNLF